MASKKINHKRDKIKAKILSVVIANIIKIFGTTLRISLKDYANICDKSVKGNFIWAFWHNRIFVMPYIYKKFARHRHGFIFTSPSGDGEIIAQVMQKFGVNAIRGSSSKKPISSLRNMLQVLRKGEDLVITPDGPRGPLCTMKSGILMLAEKTPANILPISVNYANYWELKTWDKFRIPKPFSRVEVTFHKPINIETKASNDAPRDEDEINTKKSLLLKQISALL